ncbi:hypothetical protein [Bdellovibrio svalbardensis]|uniref:Uncharacterized protein n=1 Tax=Bdellovibrio svalbardensis TaxID=2972972 RepID=A0ABT6DMN7_9BACT|nr:hypothetical protein [Bdellovibrio svalbardensis]MDG0817189.1 hypothetical protein [Bdellovibrio svalbardensis]
MKSQVLLASLLLCSSSWGLVGPSTSGGGNAVVCRNQEGKIQAAEVLDLYEARQELGFDIMPSTGDVFRDYTRAVKNGYRLQGVVTPASEQEIRDNLTRFENRVKWLPKDEKLPNVGDIGSVISVPENCSIEQLAIYYDGTDQVEISQEIWFSLDSLSKAALINHEVVYKFLRTLPEKADVTSHDARITNAASFANNVVPVKRGISSSSQVSVACENFRGDGSCISPTIFYKALLQNTDGSGSLKLQFTALAGRPLMSETTLTIPLSVTENSVYPIVSQQLRGWSAKIVRDSSRGPWAVKALIFKGTLQITEVAL